MSTTPTKNNEFHIDDEKNIMDQYKPGNNKKTPKKVRTNPEEPGQGQSDTIGLIVLMCAVLIVVYLIGGWLL